MYPQLLCAGMFRPAKNNKYNNFGFGGIKRPFWYDPVWYVPVCVPPSCLSACYLAWFRLTSGLRVRSDNRTWWRSIARPTASLLLRWTLTTAYASSFGFAWYPTCWSSIVFMGICLSSPTRCVMQTQQHIEFQQQQQHYYWTFTPLATHVCFNNNTCCFLYELIVGELRNCCSSFQVGAYRQGRCRMRAADLVVWSDGTPCQQLTLTILMIWLMTVLRVILILS